MTMIVLTKKKTMFLTLLLLHTLLLETLSFSKPWLLHQPRSLSRSRLFMSSDDSINEMRKLLEASWNTETMGEVPADAESAADSTAQALMNALDQNQEPLFFVNILLPQYDITQGTNLYDEVLAVEFCIALANRLKGKSQIIVRDDNVIKTVSRILDARNADQTPKTETFDRKQKEKPPELESNVEFYDDFADFGPIGDDDSSENVPDSIPSTSSDVDSFRQQLMSQFEKEEAEEEAPPKAKKPKDAKEPTIVQKRYRLASMLGDASKISQGADMMDDVMKAVQENAQPKDDEDTIIILSAASREELLGVRGLTAKYEGKKTIIMVNCKLDPLPRELIRAQTVYNVLPLIAKPTQSETNIFGSQAKEEPVQPKVVVLRRYPRDWEVFVDSGSGFELAATVPADQVDKNGPPMQWIAGKVKQHLQSRLG